MRPAFGAARVPSPRWCAASVRSTRGVAQAICEPRGAGGRRRPDVAEALVAMITARTCANSVPPDRQAHRPPAGGLRGATRPVGPCVFESVEEMFAFRGGDRSGDRLRAAVPQHRLALGAAAARRRLLFLNARRAPWRIPTGPAAPSSGCSPRRRSPSDVVSEITERLAVARQPCSPDRPRLQAARLRVAIDDMGRRHASLQSLAALEPRLPQVRPSLVAASTRAPSSVACSNRWRALRKIDAG